MAANDGGLCHPTQAFFANTLSSIAGSVIINAENGNITVKFDIEESEDLTLWKKTGESISRTIQLKDGKKFYRFSVDN